MLPKPPSISSLMLKKDPSQFLKKVEKQELTSTDLSDTMLIGKSPTVIIRNLDAFHLYSPLPSEKTKFKLPDERFNLKNIPHIMVCMMICMV